MHKVIFKINKFGDKVVDRDITINSIEMDLDFTSKNEINIPDIKSEFILENEEFIITRKVDSIEKYDEYICYVKIVFLESIRLSKKFKDKIMFTEKTKYKQKISYDDEDNFFADI